MRFFKGCRMLLVGSVATSALEIVLDNQEIHDEMVRRTPVKRLGLPEDIAYCALYLAAPSGSFVRPCRR